MLESRHTVRIERHRIAADLVALTFANVAEEDAVVAAGANAPLVFVLHGLGSRKERHLDLCLRCAEAGFLACAIDARSHGERSTPEMRRRLADIRAPDFFPAFAETVRGTVMDVLTAASYFGASRYALVGHSMGGFVALQTALVDPRAATVACIAGALDLSQTESPLLPPEVREQARAADPVLRAAAFWPRPILLLHGDADETVPISGSRRLHTALLPVYASQPDRLALQEYPGAGHDLLPEMAERAVAWVTENFGEGRA